MTSAVEPFVGWLIATVLLSLRIAPVLAFAPPFTLVRTPALVRVLLALGLSGLMVGALPEMGPPPTEAGPLLSAAARELLLGSIFVTGHRNAPRTRRNGFPARRYRT